MPSTFASTAECGRSAVRLPSPCGCPGSPDDTSRLPFSLKILLENLLRHEDGVSVTADDIEALPLGAKAEASHEIAFRPSRVLLQDFTGVPAIVDLAAMRDAMPAGAAIRRKSIPFSRSNW